MLQISASASGSSLSKIFSFKNLSSVEIKKDCRVPHGLECELIKLVCKSDAPHLQTVLTHVLSVIFPLGKAVKKGIYLPNYFCSINDLSMLSWQL